MPDDQVTLHAALERIDVLSILLASTIQRVKLLEDHNLRQQVFLERAVATAARTGSAPGLPSGLRPPETTDH